MAASAALVLSSCSNEIQEVSNLENNGKKEIKISTYTPGMTRSTVDGVVLEDTLAVYGFSILATYPIEQYGESTIENLFSAHLAQIGEGNTWAPAVFDPEQSEFGEDESVEMAWPENLNAEVSFYALYNETKENVEIYEGKTNIDLSQYTFKYDGADLCRPQVDYMAAKAVTSYAKSVNGSVELSFNHILAKVTTEFKSDYTDYYGGISVLEVKLAMPNSGIYDFDKNAFDNTSEGGEVVLYKGAGMSINDPDGNYSCTDDNVYAFVIPSEGAILSVTYAYIDQIGNLVSEEITKEVPVDLVPGVHNKLQIYVPSPERKQLVITTQITPWETSDAVEKTVE